MNAGSKQPQHVWPWVVGAGVGTTILMSVGYALQLDPIREEVIHTDSEGPWSGRVIAVGRWSESSLAWSSPRRIDVEFVGPTNQLERYRTSFDGRGNPVEDTRAEQQARAYMRHELVRRARG